MKKSIFIAAAILSASVVVAQQKQEKQPPPPPPPKVNMDKFVPPPPPPPKKPPPPKVTAEKFSSPNSADYKAFLKRNPNVERIGWLKNNTVRIHLRSGKEEIYNLNNEAEALKLKSNYGELPDAPPPPPPPPAPPKVIKVNRS